MNNYPILPEDGWKEVSTESSGVFSLTAGGQHCIFAGQPPAVLVGHRYVSGVVDFKTGVGESLWVRVSRPCFAVGDVNMGEPVSTLDIWLVEGQSLAIGTLNDNYNTKPTQPQISPNFKMFNQLGSTGIQDRVITPADIANLVHYEEYGEAAMSSYYTLGTTFLDGLSTKDTLWSPVGKGGATIEQIDLGGSFPSYANQVECLERAYQEDNSAEVRGVLLVHGDANYNDSGYYDKVITFRDNKLAAVQARFPDQTPPMYIYQQGGERSGFLMQRAQMDLAKAEEVTCVGASYWLNRQHPNEDETNSPSFERQHLNVLGYQYLGDMFKRVVQYGAGFKPLHVTDYEWVTPKQLTLAVHNPEVGAGLVIDTSQPNMGAIPGNGIEVERPNQQLEPANSISVSGNSITIDFATDVLPGDRIRIATTADDISYFGDYVPPVNIGDYPAVLLGTNIRSDKALPASLGNPDFYDWLAMDFLLTDQSKPSAPAVTYGSECWKEFSAQGSIGFGTSRVWLGDDVLTVNRNGIDETHTPVSRSMKDCGSSNPVIVWWQKAGKTYELSVDVAIQDDIAYFQMGIGGVTKNIQQSDIVAGKFTTTYVATSDHNVSCQLRERPGQVLGAFVGHFNNVSIREIL